MLPPERVPILALGLGQQRQIPISAIPIHDVSGTCPAGSSLNGHLKPVPANPYFHDVLPRVSPNDLEMPAIQRRLGLPPRLTHTAVIPGNLLDLPIRRLNQRLRLGELDRTALQLNNHLSLAEWNVHRVLLDRSPCNRIITSTGYRIADPV